MPHATSPRGRNLYLDLVKGLLIYLVVWGHAIQFVGYRATENWLTAPFWSDPAFKLIYLFHMPLFMGISGYLCFTSIQRATLGATATKRFRQLIIPVISWGVIWPLCLIALATIKLGDGTAWPSPPVLLTDIGHEISTRFWFLWAVFAGTLLTACARQWRWDSIAGLLVLSIALLLVPDVGIIPMIKYTVPFFFAGYLLRLHGVRLLDWVSRSRLGILFLTGVACYIFWTPATYVYTSGLRVGVPEMPRIMFIYATGAAVSLGFLYLCHLLFRHWQPRWLQHFGQHSLDIYIFQTFIFLLLHGRTHPFQETLYFSWVFAPLIALAVCGLCMLAGKTIGRVPIASQVLLGRNPQPWRQEPAPVRSASAPGAMATAEPNR